MDSLPTETEYAIIRMTRVFPPLFDKTKGFETKLYFSEKLQEWQLEVGGFYKHDTVTISPMCDGLDGYEILGRYGLLDNITIWEDLVALNWVEYQTFKDRGYTLSEAWKPYHLATGRIKVVQVEQIVEC